MKEKWILDTECGGVTAHSIENVSDQINNDEKTTKIHLIIYLSVFTISNFQE